MSHNEGMETTTAPTALKTTEELNTLVLATAADFPATLPAIDINDEGDFADWMRTNSIETGYWGTSLDGPVGIDFLTVQGGKVTIKISGYNGIIRAEDDFLTEVTSSVSAVIEIALV